jgi:hypothetical protein
MGELPSDFADLPLASQLGYVVERLSAAVARADNLDADTDRAFGSRTALREGLARAAGALSSVLGVDPSSERWDDLDDVAIHDPDRALHPEVLGRGALATISRALRRIGGALQLGDGTAQQQALREALRECLGGLIIAQTALPDRPRGEP